MRFFEYAFFQDAAVRDGQPLIPEPVISPEELDTHYTVYPGETYLRTVRVPRYGTVASLNEEGFDKARPLELHDIEWVARAANLITAQEQIELPDLLAEALRRSDLRTFSYDLFRYERPSTLSLLDMIEALHDDLENRLKTPFGAFQFFDKNWDTVLSATKRHDEASWTLTRMKRQS